MVDGEKVYTGELRYGLTPENVEKIEEVNKQWQAGYEWPPSFTPNFEKLKELVEKPKQEQENEQS